MTTSSLGAVLGSLRRDADGRFIVRVPGDWGQGRTTFGGFQVALAVRAMRAVMDADRDLPLRSLQATFVGPVPGDADVQLRSEQLRAGRAATQARCDLLHEGAVACAVVAVFGAARQSEIVREVPRPVLGLEPDALPEIPDVPGVTPVFARHFDFRWALGTPPYTGWREPRIGVFARLRDSDCTPEDALVVLADSTPPAGLSMLSRPAPASSLNWTLELLGDPAGLPREAWALIGTEVQAGADGYLSQASTLWGPGGHAFSVSHQTVAIFG